MQEDNIEKWLASSLRKQQEENPLPYELGAWEAFEKKRNLAARKINPQWFAGVAAAVALLLLAGGVWLTMDIPSGEEILSGQVTLEQNPESNPSEVQNSPETDSQQSEMAMEGKESSAENQLAFSTPKPNSKQFLTEDRGAKVGSPLEITGNQNTTQPVSSSAESKIKISDQGQQFAQETRTPVEEKPVIAQAELPKEPMMSDEEIAEVLSDEKSFFNLIMGLSPGFGTSQGTDQTTSGSSLGLGVLVDVDLPGKLSLGSGLAVNYLNQASQSQTYAQVAGLSSPVTQTSEISQVQVDLPLYVKYPITRNQSISVQAGFSNLLTFNQNAEQQSSYTRQVAVLDASVAGANSFTLKSESVNQTQDLSVPGQKFYPFATANFGVNIRLYESKKTSYEVMPFYNYPLQEFSGYGEKLGMVGASFRVNFGAIQKK